MRWRNTEYKGYLISSCGKVWSCKTKRIMKTFICRQGYENIQLYDGKGNKIHTSIHRLVASSFIRNEQDKPVVNHIDGDKRNNNVTNLEWSTTSENNKHAYKLGLSKTPILRGERGGNSKLTEKEAIKIIILRKSGMKIKEIGDMFRVTDTTVSNIYSGKTWSHLDREVIS